MPTRRPSCLSSYGTARGASAKRVGGEKTIRGGILLSESELVAVLNRKRRGVRAKNWAMATLAHGAPQEVKQRRKAGLCSRTSTRSEARGVRQRSKSDWYAAAQRPRRLTFEGPWGPPCSSSVKTKLMKGKWREVRRVMMCGSGWGTNWTDSGKWAADRGGNQGPGGWG